MNQSLPTRENPCFPEEAIMSNPEAPGLRAFPLHDPILEQSMMTRRSITAGALVFALAVAHGTLAQAQFFGYPGGFGGFGWEGWGGAHTHDGDLARGMGVYAAGAGFYNKQTAIANSIDVDTVMRWNQYIHESQLDANR